MKREDFILVDKGEKDFTSVKIKPKNQEVKFHEVNLKEVVFKKNGKIIRIKREELPLIWFYYLTEKK